MSRTNEFTEILVDYIDGRLKQTRFSNLWLGGGAGLDGGSSFRPIDGQLTQRHVSYDTSEPASPCAPSGFSSLVDNLRRMRYWQEPATWFGVETTSGLQVTIKPGLWYPSTTEYCAFAGGDSPTFTLPGVLDRIDTVYVDPSGILHIQRGTPAVTPTITLPAIASGIPLWAVYLTPTTSGIYHSTCSGYYAGQGYIERDLRPFLNLGGGGVVGSGVLPDVGGAGYALRSNGINTWEATFTPHWYGTHRFFEGLRIDDAKPIYMGDEAWIGCGAAAERIIFDEAGDICVMGAKFGIGVNPPDMELHVHGANSVTIKLTNDDTGITGNVGLDIGVGTSEQAYMWNRENTELSFGTNNLRRMTILANGKIGINAATIPYAGHGAAMLALHGTDVSADGPHIQITTDNDDYPLLQVLADKHDAVHLVFDAYYDYASWKSSDFGSNCMLHKESDYLQISYDSGIIAGNNITWNTGIVLNLITGYVGMGIAVPTAHLDVYNIAINTTTSFSGIRSYHVKTAGATGEEDDIIGIQSHIEIADNLSTVGHVWAVDAMALLTDGIIGDGQEDIRAGNFEVKQVGGTAADSIMVFQARANLDFGTVTNDVFGFRIEMDIEDTMTDIGGNIYGFYIYGVADQDPGGLAYLAYLTGSTNIDYSLYSTSAAPSYFAGDVGIGLVPSYKLDVKDDTAGLFVGNFFNDGDNVNRHVLSLQGGADNGAAVGTTYYIYAEDGNGGVTGCVCTIDGVFQTVNLSDEGSKINIEDTKISGLDIINDLLVRDYNWESNPDGPSTIGFVAQEAQLVYPNMIAEFLDTKLGTSRTALIPILTKAIQELTERIEQLELLKEERE